MEEKDPEVPSICTNCQRHLKAWAESRRPAWKGCNLLLDEHSGVDDPEKTGNDIFCEEMAMGWVTNGGMAFNYQILNKGTTKCRYFQQK
jgi:hypothetical protein